MKLRTTLAGLSAAAIALSGLMLGGTAANAADLPGGYVPVADISSVTPLVEYNEWHFAPNILPAIAPTQLPNGFIAPGAQKIQVMLGNGNDAAQADPATPATGPGIQVLAESLRAVSSNPAAVWYQVPVFYNYGAGPDGGWKFTTLRQASSNTGGSDWISSAEIVGTSSTVPANTDTPLTDIVAALGSNSSPYAARAIGAGFMVDTNTDVLVSTFTINTVTTRFYDEPLVGGLKPAVSEFVHSSNINPDESTFAGWHQGVDTDPGTFASVGAASGAVNGLNVEGPSQILLGYAPEDYAHNNLPEIIEAGAWVTGTPADDAAGYTFQVAIYYYLDGVVGPQFTTLRTELTEGGMVSAEDGVVWTTSRAIPGFDAGQSGNFEDIVGSLGSNYQVIGHGFYVESGSVLAQNVYFNGRTTNFTKAAVVPAAPKGPQPIANTGAVENMAPMIGIAALALLTLGGVTLAARRRLQHN